MDEMRIALTVLPLGPRGQKVIQAAVDDNKPLWFGLQIAPGFAKKQDATEALLKELWPWKLHVVNGDKVAVNGWLGQTPLTIDDAIIADDDFAKTLRAQIEAAYAKKELLTDLDLRLLVPKESEAEPEYHRHSFASRLQYLATLPGELSRRLMTTLFVKIAKATDLFVKSGNDWKPNEDVLYLAPKEVLRETTKIALAGPPKQNGDFFEVKDGGGTTMGLGPGFALKDFTEPNDKVFDLATYNVAVGGGDRRFIELETILLDALDPFAQLARLRDGDKREQFQLIDAGGGIRRPLPPQTFLALVDLWRVRELAEELVAAFPAILERRLPQFLVPGDKTALVIPERWRNLATQLDVKTVSALDIVRWFAARLNIDVPDLPSLVRAVAERAGLTTVAVLAAQAFDEMLTATPNAAALIAAWRFGNPEKVATLAERRIAFVQAVVREMREERLVPSVYASLTLTAGSEDMIRTKLIDTIKQRWEARVDSNAVAALIALGLASNAETQLATTLDLGKEAEAHVNAIWPAADTARPELPGRGLPLVIGDPKKRHVHETDAGSNIYREIAGVLLFARRSSINSDDLRNQRWRIVTGGTAFAGELAPRVFAPGQDPEIKDEEWLQALLPVPLRPVFQQSIARADVEYHGHSMLAQSPLDRAYQADAYQAEEDRIDALPETFSYQSVGSFSAKVPIAADASAAPPLRYGDHYEFRAWLMDQAGGLAPDVAGAEPWQLDPALPKLKMDDVQAPMHYLRRVPVGEINIVPTKAPKAAKPEWPALPEDVALRAREWWALTHDDAEAVPALLFSKDARLTGTRAQYAFTLNMPSIDEHTLLRWAMPAVGDANAKVQIEKITRTLTKLFELRVDEVAHPLHDPAVTAIGVRIRAGDPKNAVTTIFEEPIPLGADTDFQYPPRTIRVVCGGPKGEAKKNGDALEISIPEKWFAAVEFFPLVAEADLAQRFDAAALAELIDAEAHFAGFVAFRASVVLLESATDELPKQEALYDGFVIEEQSGNAVISFRAKQDVDDLVFVDRYSIERERWVWRNLPIVPDLSTLSGAEKIRRAASGPPEEVFGDKKDEPYTLPVIDWEAIAGLDRGFADRGRLTGRWPRVAPKDDTTAGGPARNVLLAIDDRDAISAADYLRFGLRVRSRYAGVLAEKEQFAKKRGSTRRRLTFPFRGQEKIKPPKILSVVPLTASLQNDPLSRPPGVTPFLVLLDETFFREYGVGERLEARLSRVNLDIGEDPQAPLPYRTGPLPDHYLPIAGAGDDRYYLKKRIKDGEELALEVFGPFGYSLDVTPSEALANATAFVVYAPADVGVQWNLFVRFRRVLDLPSDPKTRFSEWSDSYALYTLSDERMLASTGDNALLTIRKNVAKAALRDLRVVLDPVEQKQNSAAASQYRYFLLVSRVIAGAGQGFDAELPAALWRIPARQQGFIKPKTFDVEHLAEIDVVKLALDAGAAPPDANGEYRGRILEVMLNGRYPHESRLDLVAKWRDFWTALLDDRDDRKEIDAAGMIRRVSESFPVRIE